MIWALVILFSIFLKIYMKRQMEQKAPDIHFDFADVELQLGLGLAEMLGNQTCIDAIMNTFERKIKI